MKLWNYLVIMLTMLIIMEFVGITTGLNPTLQSFGVNITDAQVTTADIEQSAFYEKIFNNTTGVLIVLLGAGAVVIGLFAKGYDPSLVVLPLVIWVATIFAGTFWGIITLAEAGWIRNIIVTIMVPLGAGFIWSCVEFFRGVD